MKIHATGARVSSSTCNFAKRQLCESPVISYHPSTKDLPVFWQKSKQMVALDLSSAFDCVSHSKLLNRLNEFGVFGNVLKWTLSYLSGRTQRIVVEDSLSNLSSCTVGVPHGSVMGPLMFTVYVAPIGRIIEGYVRCGLSLVCR
jgi:Reverse transcriptase (RNA-dependent DNA polymerase)